jgi:hypothetical protein
MFLLVKIFLTAALLAGIAAVGSHSTRAAAALSALPIQSLVVILWLYADTRDVERIGALAQDMLWMLPLTFFFFGVLAVLLKSWGALWPALGASLVVLAVSYVGYAGLLRRWQ